MSRVHPALPPAVSRPWVLCAACTFLVSWVLWWGWAALFLAPALVIWLSVRGRLLTASVVTAAAVLSMLASAPLDPLPEGRIEGRGAMATDVIDGRYVPYALVSLDVGLVLTDLPLEAAASRGEMVHIVGKVVGEPGTMKGRRHRGPVRVDSFEVLAGPSSPILSLGNAMHDRVATRLAPLEGGRALLAGFLVGDTSGVDEVDQSAMRRAGLSHFTAVSGSNVALFLGMLFVLAGPIGIGPKRRAIVGLLGLPIFAAATRFEPSVMRASAMAALGLGGRLVGFTLEAWQLISAAVIGLLLLDPALATNAGFQLSVAATIGVVVGARWPMRHNRVARALAVAIGAQTAVAPLLVLHFGVVPLLSPLVNLLAAPVVSLSTALGAIGVLGPSMLATMGSSLAEVVLWMARVASGWPQMGWLGLLTIVAAVFLHMRAPRLRGALALLAATAIAFMLIAPDRQAPNPGVVVLDVGQGDAILVSGGQGRFALVDGGPDPARLIESLQAYGVRELELVVLTHVHADHATGLTGLIGRFPIGHVWAHTDPHESAASRLLFRLLEASRVPVSTPRVGERWQLGDIELLVEAPLRRYASPNDQSIVLTVTGPSRSMLLAGDIETVAQADLDRLRADVLKVPHQGAATSDARWLKNVGADLAVISVGPNDFGHPAGWVIDALEASGAAVVRTDLVGDVVVPLS